MTDDTPRMEPLHYRPDPARHARCAWFLCQADATDRYPVQMCQEHILYVWSLVDEELRESAKTLDDLKREAEEQYLNSERVKEQMARSARERARNRKRGYVYVLEVGGMIKIGFTANPFRRGGEYPPSSELLALHPGSPGDEKALHEKFSAYREAGREWYMDCQEIRDYVTELSAATGRWEKSMFRNRKRSDKTVRGIREKGHYVV